MLVGLGAGAGAATPEVAIPSITWKGGRGEEENEKSKRKGIA